MAFKYLRCQNIVKTGRQAVASEPQTDVADQAGSSLLCTSQGLLHAALIPQHLEFTEKNSPCANPACQLGVQHILFSTEYLVN